MAYHLSPNGPRLCKATSGPCPYGIAGDVHYATQAEAQQAYETRMAEAFGATESLKRTTGETSRQAAYQMRDELRAVKNAFLDQAALARALPSAQRVHSFLTGLKTLPARTVDRLEAWDANMQRRSVEARDRSAARLQHLAHLAEISGRRVQAASIKATEKVKRDFADYRSAQDAARAEKPLRQRFAPAHRIQQGDVVDGMTVAKIVDNGSEIKLYLRRPSGTFAGMKVYNDTAVVPYQRPRRRDLKRTQSSHRRPWRESAFVKRVRAASELQAQAAKTLFSLEGQARVKRPVEMRRPLPQRYRRATSVVRAEQAEAAFMLQGLAGERKRKKARV